jgi:hypothetical protein
MTDICPFGFGDVHLAISALIANGREKIPLGEQFRPQSLHVQLSVADDDLRGPLDDPFGPSLATRGTATLCTRIARIRPARRLEAVKVSRGSPAAWDRLA